MKVSDVLKETKLRKLVDRFRIALKMEDLDSDEWKGYRKQQTEKCKNEIYNYLKRYGLTEEMSSEVFTLATNQIFYEGDNDESK